MSSQAGCSKASHELRNAARVLHPQQDTQDIGWHTRTARKQA